MAAAPTPDPSQQPQQQPQQDGGAPDAGAQQQGPPPELKALGQLLTACQQLAQQVPAASSGLAKAIAGIHEAASAVMSGPQQQAPQQSPPY